METLLIPYLSHKYNIDQNLWVLKDYWKSYQNCFAVNRNDLELNVVPSKDCDTYFYSILNWNCSQQQCTLLCVTAFSIWIHGPMIWFMSMHLRCICSIRQCTVIIVCVAVAFCVCNKTYNPVWNCLPLQKWRKIYHVSRILSSNEYVYIALRDAHIKGTGYSWYSFSVFLQGRQILWFPICFPAHQNIREDTQENQQLWSTSFPWHKKDRWGNNKDKTNTIYETSNAQTKKTCSRDTYLEWSISKPIPYRKGAYPKRTEFVPRVSFFLLLEQTLFQNGRQTNFPLRTDKISGIYQRLTLINTETIKRQTSYRIWMCYCAGELPAVICCKMVIPESTMCRATTNI